MHYSKFYEAPKLKTKIKKKKKKLTPRQRARKESLESSREKGWKTWSNREQADHVYHPWTPLPPLDARSGTHKHYDKYNALESTTIASYLSPRYSNKINHRSQQPHRRRHGPQPRHRELMTGPGNNTSHHTHYNQYHNTHSPYHVSSRSKTVELGADSYGVPIPYIPPAVVSSSPLSHSSRRKQRVPRHTPRRHHHHNHQHHRQHDQEDQQQEQGSYTDFPPNPSTLGGGNSGDAGDGNERGHDQGQNILFYNSDGDNGNSGNNGGPWQEGQHDNANKDDNGGPIYGNTGSTAHYSSPSRSMYSSTNTTTPRSHRRHRSKTERNPKGAASPHLSSASSPKEQNIRKAKKMTKSIGAGTLQNYFINQLIQELHVNYSLMERISTDPKCRSKNHQVMYDECFKRDTQLRKRLNRWMSEREKATDAAVQVYMSNDMRWLDSLTDKEREKIESLIAIRTHDPNNQPPMTHGNNHDYNHHYNGDAIDKGKQYQHQHHQSHMNGNQQSYHNQEQSKPHTLKPLRSLYNEKNNDDTADNDNDDRNDTDNDKDTDTASEKKDNNNNTVQGDPDLDNLLNDIELDADDDKVGDGGGSDIINTSSGEIEV